MTSNKKDNKNTIKNLINHNYDDRIHFSNYYNIKNNIFNSYVYIIKNAYDLRNNDYYNTFCKYDFYDDYVDSLQIKNNFENDILSFFTIKKELCKKEKEQRRKYRMIKPFVNHYKICHDIQNIIISFI